MALLEFWLSTADWEERLRLPVNPEQVAVKSSHGYEDVQVTQLGEYTIIGEATLREISFASFFPRDFHPGYCEYEGFQDPWTMVATIERWIASRKPIWLNITGTRLDRLPVTIRSFPYSERAGSPGDVYYDLELKEYKEVQFRQVDLSESGNATVADEGQKRPDTRSIPAVYVVATGDTLWAIAQRTLGDGDRWRDVYAVNRMTIGKDPNRIHPGQMLAIPS